MLYPCVVHLTAVLLHGHSAQPAIELLWHAMHGSSRAVVWIKRLFKLTECVPTSWSLVYRFWYVWTGLLDSLGSLSLSPHDPLALDLMGDNVHLNVCVCVCLRIRMCILLTPVDSSEWVPAPYTHTHSHTTYTLVIDDSNLCLTFSEKEVECGVGSGGLKTRNTRWILMYWLDDPERSRHRWILRGQWDLFTGMLIYWACLSWFWLSVCVNNTGGKNEGCCRWLSCAVIRSVEPEVGNSAGTCSDLYAVIVFARR